MARTIEVPQNVQEVIRGIRISGINLVPPAELYNSEVKEAKRSLRGNDDEVHLPVPARLQTVTQRRGPEALGRWTASLLHAAVDRVGGRDRRTAITLVFPNDNRLHVALTDTHIEIQQL